MTVRELAKRLGVSASTIYRRIKKGIIKATKVGRRWKIQQETEMEWHPQVNKRFAVQDGLKPEDFQFEQWPVSNVRLENSESRHAAFYFKCDVPDDIPLDNQYIQEKDRKPGVEYEPAEKGWLKIPDPVGMCLSGVTFQLYSETHDLLCEKSSLPVEGTVQTQPGDRIELWNRLTPGTSINVKLVVYPMFYYLKEDGSAMNAYAASNQGYFKGKEVVSQTYRLDMDQDGNVRVDSYGN